MPTLHRNSLSPPAMGIACDTMIAQFRKDCIGHSDWERLCNDAIASQIQQGLAVYNGAAI